MLNESDPATTSAIISTFRNNYTVFQLERIQRVTGKDFPVSGDAPLRFKNKMTKSGTYGKTA
jgi:hypothetical protein